MKTLSTIVVPAILLASQALAQDAMPSPQSAATAQQLLSRSGKSLEQRHVGLALLQYAQAHRLDPAAAEASSVGGRIQVVLEEEERVAQAAQAAAQRLDRAAVVKAMVALRRIDTHSSAALELALRANALMVDRGGIVQRVPIAP